MEFFEESLRRLAAICSAGFVFFFTLSRLLFLFLSLLFSAVSFSKRCVVPVRIVYLSIRFDSVFAFTSHTNRQLRIPFFLCWRCCCFARSCAVSFLSMSTKLHFFGTVIIICGTLSGKCTYDPYDHFVQHLIQ